MFFSGDQLSQTQRTLGAGYARERRTTNRRPLKGSVLLSIPDKGILCGDMVDIGTSGVSVIVATPLEYGQGCRVCFSIRLGAQKVPIDCIGIVANSVCVVRGFRIGMRFIISDIREQKVIERYIAEGQCNSLTESTHKSNSPDSPVKLDPPAVVNFGSERYPKTIRISDLNRR